MLICSRENFAFIAVPKTGTTAVEMALKPRADIILTKFRKHITAQRFHNKIAPFLDEVFDLRPDRVAVMRDPVEQIRSWYRYRAGSRQKGTETATHGLSFDEFVADVIADDPPPHAGIGSQWNMLTSGKGAVLVHHLFAHEAPVAFRGFLNDRFGEEIRLKPKNVSPQVDAPLSPSMLARLRAARAEEFALYDRLMDAGGHLVTRIG
ncbi:MAG TPA: hypothetical protein DEA05_01205 [Rhodobacteraceae bacterium]|nr:hypothetical protein [Paracoccaceae bacterium]